MRIQTALAATWMAIVVLSPIASADQPPAQDDLTKQINFLRENSGKNAIARDVVAAEIGVIFRRDPRAFNELMKLLQEAPIDVKGDAAIALGYLGDERGIEPLRQLLKDLDSRIEASRIPFKPPLVDAFKKSDLTEDEFRQATMLYETKYSIASALARLGQKSVSKILLEALECPRTSLARVRAAVALGVLKDPETVEPLIELLKHKERFVAISAAGILADIGDSRAVEPLIENLDRLNVFAVEALVKIGDSRAFKPLRERTQSKDEVVRITAAEGLYHLGEKQYLDVIIEALKSSAIVESIPVSYIAAQKLRMLGDKRAIPALEEAAKRDPNNAEIKKIVEELRGKK